MASHDGPPGLRVDEPCEVLAARSVVAAGAHRKRLVDGSMQGLIDEQPRVLVVVDDEREGNDRRVDVARLGKLERLTHVLSEDESGLQPAPEAHLLESLPSRLSVRCVLWIRDSNTVETRIREVGDPCGRCNGSATRPDRNPPTGIGRLRRAVTGPRGHHFVDKGYVGCCEDVERRTLTKLLRKEPRRPKGEGDRAPRLPFEVAPELLEGKREIRSGGDANRGARGALRFALAGARDGERHEDEKGVDDAVDAWLANRQMTSVSWV